MSTFWPAKLPLTTPSRAGLPVSLYSLGGDQYKNNTTIYIWVRFRIFQINLRARFTDFPEILLKSHVS
ncbi:unnamed protein product [Trichogramma brassicae]|uniref:Uncharacterized protein n=1 Tax=Trichogramma brassicae TaxID=86971 RepID=A0A6H5I2M6_9HYME|nr:unnamed protein product [Trichogramma brassicae]